MSDDFCDVSILFGLVRGLGQALEGIVVVVLRTHTAGCMGDNPLWHFLIHGNLGCNVRITCRDRGGEALINGGTSMFNVLLGQMI